MAVAVAYLLGPAVGRIIQFVFTTSPSVDDLEITGVQVASSQGVMGGLLGGHGGSYLVRTAPVRSRREMKQLKS